jgi:hypothetical protein
MNKKEQGIIGLFAARRQRDLAELYPDALANVSLCYDNVLEKITRDGGSIAYGYVFYRVGSIMDAIPHVIWRDAKGALIDITPHDFFSGTYNVGIGDKQLFLADDAAKSVVVKERVIEFREDGSVRAIYDPGWQTCRPSKSFAMTKAVRREVVPMNQNDYANARAIMRAAEGALAV